MSVVVLIASARAQDTIVDPPLAGSIQFEEPPRIIDRGQDFALYRAILLETDEAGHSSRRTNEFTLLENALHYRDSNGQWRESEDLIESAPDGAIARRGPHKAFFTRRLDSEAVFDIQTSSGRHVRGGLRAIQITDPATGKSQTLATVRENAAAELLPPNQLLWKDAFEGLSCDVLLIWSHDRFSQDVILREKPKLPEGWDLATARLEVLTEFMVEERPTLREQALKTEDGLELSDHTVIQFDSLSIIMGKALALEEGRAFAFGSLDATDQSVPVLKQWRELDDGRTFLIESLGWKEIEPRLKDLRERAEAKPARDSNTTLVQTWPRHPAPGSRPEPILAATEPYRPDGFLLDFVIIPDQQNPTTFLSGVTYYIKTGYSSGSLVTFQPACVIKYKHNANMMLYGSVSFPPVGQARAVFTSRNDDKFGDKILGVVGESDSNGDPTYHTAAQAIWIYYPSQSTTIRNARIRWAKTGIRYDQSQSLIHTVADCYFENIAFSSAVGISGISPYNLSLQNVRKCNVPNPGVSGMIQDCSITTDGGIVVVNSPVNDADADGTDPNGDPHKNSQSECSFVVVNPNRIVAAFFDTHLTRFGLGGNDVEFGFSTAPRAVGWSTSYNGGSSFYDQGAIPPAAPSQGASLGDAGDPVMDRNKATEEIYLLANPSRESDQQVGYRLWKSTDYGLTFTGPSAILTTILQADKPILKVNNVQGLANSGHLYAGGTGKPTPNGTNGVYVGHSSTGGATWDGLTQLEPFSQAIDIAFRPNGTVYAFYLSYDQGSAPHVNRIKYRWLLPGQSNWSGPLVMNAHGAQQDLYSREVNGDGRLKRSKVADAQDYFNDNAFPRVAVNPVSGRVYVVYADLPSLSATDDRGDIFLNEGVPNADGSLTWTGAQKVNIDVTPTDQWNPSIAVNPAGTKVFIGYYSRQEDIDFNWMIKAYGAKVEVSNGQITTNTCNFPISLAVFPPLFAGIISPSAPWNYDAVWCQGNVWMIKSNATYHSEPDPYLDFPTPFAYEHFCGDDYTWTVADNNYFYFAWCDRSLSCVLPYGGASYLRADANIRFAKIRQ